MNITKVKLGGEVPVHVAWEETGSRDGEKRVTTFECKEEPHPDLKKAASALLTAVLERMELTSISFDARFSGVSVKYSDEWERGFVCTILVDRANYNSPLVLNSPFVRRSMPEEDPDNNPEAFVNPDEDDALDLLLREVAEYVGGRKRAQADLFEGEPSEERETVGVEG